MPVTIEVSPVPSPRKPGRRKYTPAEKHLIAGFLAEKIADAQEAARALRVALRKNRVDWVIENIKYWDHVAGGFKWALAHVTNTKRGKDGTTAADG